MPRRQHQLQRSRSSRCSADISTGTEEHDVAEVAGPLAQSGKPTVVTLRPAAARAVDDGVDELQGSNASNPAANVELQDLVVDGRKVAMDVAAQHVREPAPEPLVVRHGPVRALLPRRFA